MWSKTPVYVAGFERGVRPIGDWSMLMILSIRSMPVDAVVRAGAQPRAVEAVGDRAVEDLVDQRRLAGARDAGDGGEDAERELRRRSPSGCAGGRCGSTSSPSGSRRSFGHRDRALARRGTARSATPASLTICAGVPSATTSPPSSPAPGPMSTTWSAARIVPSSCSTTITVLPRSRSRSSVRDQALVVALVQADRGLVEDVEDADQARADLGREPDPLRLAARQRRRRALERQVADPDRVEEPEPLADLADDEPRDRALGLGQLERADPLERGAGRHAACTRRR